MTNIITKNFPRCEHKQAQGKQEHIANASIGGYSIFEILKTASPIILIAAAVILIFNSSTFTSALEFNRLQLDSQPWRIITAHFTHWNLKHLIYDLSMFMIFGFITILINKKIFYTILFSVPIISCLAIYILKSNMILYRGLSGIDTAFFAFSIAYFCIQSYKKKQTKEFIFCLLAIIALSGKTIFETINVQALFVSEGFILEPYAHLIGITIGYLCIILTVKHTKKSYYPQNLYKQRTKKKRINNCLSNLFVIN